MIIFVQMLVLLFASFTFFSSFFCILEEEFKNMEMTRKLNKLLPSCVGCRV